MTGRPPKWTPSPSGSSSPAAPPAGARAPPSSCSKSSRGLHANRFRLSRRVTRSAGRRLRSRGAVRLHFAIQNPPTRCMGQQTDEFHASAFPLFLLTAEGNDPIAPAGARPRPCERFSCSQPRRRGWPSNAQESTCPRYGSTLGLAKVFFPTRPSRAPLFFKFTTLEYLVVVGAICANRVDHSYLTPNLHNTEPEWRQRALGEGIVQHGPSRVEHQFPNQSHCKKRRPFGVLPTRDVSAAKCSRRMLLPRRRFFAPSIFDVPLFAGLAMSCAIGTSFPESRWRVQCSKSGLFPTR